VSYAYLNDVPHLPRLSDGPESAQHKEWLRCFSASRWFTRGWTLQELIAPRRLVFFSVEWEELGTKMDLAETIFNITEIPRDTLIYGDAFGESVSRRMSWAAKRQTTRIEDMAYCLLGIFDINMPLLYGEGERAFQRLQEEIVKITDDETIFAWKAENSTFATWRSLFARSPAEFSQSGLIVPNPNYSGRYSQSHVITNKGLRIRLRLSSRKDIEKGWHSRTEFIAVLKCHPDRNIWAPPICICIKRVFGDEYVRVDANQLYISSNPRFLGFSTTGNGKYVTVRQRLDYAPWYSFYKCFRVRGIWLKNTSPKAVLEEMHPREQWNSDSDVFHFKEEDLRSGHRQVVRCIFSIENSKSVVALYFNPREEYRGTCCYYKVKEGNVTVSIESLVRVINGEAFLAVGLKLC
jgi:hypothetical protein